MRSRKMRAETAAKMKVCSQVLGCRNGKLNQVCEKTVTNSKAIPRASRMLGALRGRAGRVRLGFSGNPMIIREQNGSDCYNSLLDVGRRRMPFTRIAARNELPA